MPRMFVNKFDIEGATIFESLSEHFPHMIHFVDDKGRIVYANKATKTLLGYTREDLLTMNIREVLANSSRGSIFSVYLSKA